MKAGNVRIGVWMMEEAMGGAILGDGTGAGMRGGVGREIPFSCFFGAC